jgi:hypothetical protein
MANEIMVVLEDGETWAADGFVYILKNNDSYPDGDANDVDENEVVANISINDLLLAYNKVHGTSY